MLASAEPAYLPAMDAARDRTWYSHASAVSEAASAALVVAVAGACLWLLTATLSAGSGTAGPGERGQSGDQSGQQTLSQPHLEPHLILVTVTAARAEEVRFALAYERTLRAALSEVPRDAEVIAATSVGEAQGLADAINDQTNIPGATRMTAVVMR